MQCKSRSAMQASIPQFEKTNSSLKLWSLLDGLTPYSLMWNTSCTSYTAAPDTIFFCVVPNLILWRFWHLQCMLDYLSVSRIQGTLDMDYRIFNLCMWSFCMRIHTGGLNLLSHLHGFCREFAQNLTLEKSEGTSLAKNGHPSMWTPCSIVHHQLFYQLYLPVMEVVHYISLSRNSTHHLIFNLVIRLHTCKVFRMEFFSVSGWASCEHSMAALMWAQGPNLFICVARSSVTLLLALRLQLSTKHRATCARKRRVLYSVKLLILYV